MVRYIHKEFEYKAYGKVKHILRTKRISKRTKINIYEAIIKPVVLYAAELMRLTHIQRTNNLRVFEIKTIRIICEPKKVSKDLLRSLMNHEIQEVLIDEDMVKMINVQKMKWYRHRNGKRENSAIRKIMKRRANTNRSWSRPKSKWEEEQGCARHKDNGVIG